MTWERTGGGCCLQGKEAYPCDDDFENAETGERLRFYSTMEAHFAMPRTVETLIEVRDLDGVEDRVRIMGKVLTGMERGETRPEQKLGACERCGGGGYLTVASPRCPDCNQGSLNG